MAFIARNLREVPSRWSKSDESSGGRATKSYSMLAAICAAVLGNGQSAVEMKTDTVPKHIANARFVIMMTSG
jgi:hypothetical protein